MFTFRVSYILSAGRDMESSEEILEVKVASEYNPIEFFSAVRNLMGAQCNQGLTAQYYIITLCPVYIVISEDFFKAYFSYRKFSKKFMKEVRVLRDPRFID